MSFLRSLFSLQPASITIEPEPDHTHQFETRFVAYAAPRRDLQSTVGDPKLVEKALFGMTTILSKCLLCPLSKQEEVLGSDRPQIDALLDNVEQYGPQYMQRDNAVFVLQRHNNMQPNPAMPLPNALPSMLPLRS